MRKITTFLALPMTFGVLFLLACKTPRSGSSDGYMGVHKAGAVLKSTAGNSAHGTVTFTSCPAC